MVWGDPNFDQLMEFMKKAYDEKVYYQEHSWTRDMVNGEKVKGELLKRFRSSQENQKAVSDNLLVF
jgi:hypothetical protein